jgi:hypothetical protein
MHLGIRMNYSMARVVDFATQPFARTIIASGNDCTLNKLEAMRSAGFPLGLSTTLEKVLWNEAAGNGRCASL